MSSVPGENHFLQRQQSSCGVCWFWLQPEDDIQHHRHHPSQPVSKILEAALPKSGRMREKFLNKKGDDGGTEQYIKGNFTTE